MQRRNPVLRRCSFALSALAVAVLAVATPQRASACGPYGPAMTEAQLAVYREATASLTDAIAVAYKPAKIEGERATQWLKVRRDDTTRWRKIKLTRIDGEWINDADFKVSCRS